MAKNESAEAEPTRNKKVARTSGSRAVTKTLEYFAPEANTVAIVGDFNNWNPQSHPMQRMPDGAWRIEVSMHHGHHQYGFVVDGVLTLDPRAQGISRNEKGERVSLIAVS